MSEIKKEEQLSFEVAFKELKDRIKKTRKSRIEASKRLRNKHGYYEKITHFYSLIVLILSVWFLNNDGAIGMFAAKILLVLSLSLTYFTMFLNMKNYKERAGNFETNYQQLDVLLNKLDRDEAEGCVIDKELLKSYQREYEKLIIGNENHMNIDFYTSSEKNREKFKSEIKSFNKKSNFLMFLTAIYPLLLLLLIFLFNWFLGLIVN